MSEQLKIFDASRNLLGTASREEVHQFGYWHETFHCWIVERTDSNDYIYLQKRSKNKKDFPSLYDITAAGHLLADESVTDGIREVREELGIDVSFDQLYSLGIIEETMSRDSLDDREFCHTYLYLLPDSNPTFHLQVDEVAGIVKTEFNQFYNFCFGYQHNLLVEGYTTDQQGRYRSISSVLYKENFVSHKSSYWEQIARKINNALHYC